MIEVWNKIDLMPGADAETVRNRARRTGGAAVAISAVSGEGIDELLLAIEGKLEGHHEVLDVDLDAADGALIHWLHENADVLARDCDDERVVHYRVRISAAKRERLMARIEAGG